MTRKKTIKAVHVGPGHHVDGDFCPHCKEFLDGATAMSSDGKSREKPKAGDITICLYCAEWSAFTASGRLIVPSEKTLKHIKNDAIAQITEQATRRLIASPNAKLRGTQRKDAMTGHLLALGAKHS